MAAGRHFVRSFSSIPRGDISTTFCMHIHALPRFEISSTNLAYIDRYCLTGSNFGDNFDSDKIQNGDCRLDKIFSLGGGLTLWTLSSSVFDVYVLMLQVEHTNFIEMAA